ncbi:hypothetical protein ACSNOI_02620 [Actinomadura kijaniata]|uniref:hypothetical protein n=1 Tax=Actinomadura kijaniata TaxID=46161 RepID=UPI003F1A8E13
MAPPERPRSLPDAGKEIKVDHDKLKDLADQLQKDLDDLRNQKLVEALEDHAKPGQKAIGNYSAGQGLNMTVNTAQNAIGNTYDQFLQSYQKVIDALRRSNQTHRDADDNAKKAANNVGGKRYAT